MKRILLAAALCALASVAGAQTTSPSPATPAVVFTTVDAVAVQASRVIVTGILQGDTAPTQWYTQPLTGDTGAFAQNCQRAALLAMSKPGQYLLEISGGGGFTTPVCKLTRAAP